MKHPTLRGTGQLLRATIKYRPASRIRVWFSFLYSAGVRCMDHSLQKCWCNTFLLHYVYIFDVKLLRIKQCSTKKRHLLTILRKNLDFKVLVVSHL